MAGIPAAGDPVAGIPVAGIPASGRNDQSVQGDHVVCLWPFVAVGYLKLDPLAIPQAATALAANRAEVDQKFLHRHRG